MWTKCLVLDCWSDKTGHLTLKMSTSAFKTYDGHFPNPGSFHRINNRKRKSPKLLHRFWFQKHNWADTKRSRFFFDGEFVVSICRSLFSLLDVHLSPTVTSLNLHCNHIPRIEGLTSAWHLRHLDLSSNCISKIEGLSSLTSLRTLNLSCNLITKVEGKFFVSILLGQ